MRHAGQVARSRGIESACMAHQTVILQCALCHPVQPELLRMLDAALPACLHFVVVNGPSLCCQIQRQRGRRLRSARVREGEGQPAVQKDSRVAAGSVQGISSSYCLFAVQPLSSVDAHPTPRW